MMKRYFLSLVVFLSFHASAETSVFIYTEHYGSHPKMRKEYAVKRVDCQPTVKARKIFIDETNELREVAYWDEKGKFSEGNDENWPIRLKVQEVFNQGKGGADPCLKPNATESVNAAGAVQQ